MRSKREASKPSFYNEREFGLIVGLMFILIGSWWLYRGAWKTAASCLLGIGSVLAILGWLLPKALVLPRRAWMALAMYMSLVTTPVILAIVYFLLFMPIGVIKRLSGWDPLRRRALSEPSYWCPYNERQRDPRHYEKMY